MLSSKKMLNLGFADISEYYNYIIDSIINGQRGQVKDLLLNLSGRQKLDFLAYLHNNFADAVTLKSELQNILINL